MDIRLTSRCSVILFMLGVFPETDCCLGSHSGGTLHIFVSCYQSETSGWVPAASHRLACPDITRLSAAAWVRPWQLCIDHLMCGSAAFLFSCSHHCTGSGHSCRQSACHFWATKCCCDGLGWQCFLPISEFNRSRSRLWRLVRTASFFFGSCEATKVLFSHISPVYKKSEPSLEMPCNWYVCAASFNSKKDLQLYF